MDELYQLFPFSGYKVKHLKIADGHCRVALERQDDKPALCHVCGSPFKAIRKKQRRTVEDLRMLDKLRNFLSEHHVNFHDAAPPRLPLSTTFGGGADA